MAGLPSWVAAEYEGLVKTRPLTEDGPWVTVYAAIRRQDANEPHIIDFIALAKDTCKKSLKKIKLG